MGFYSSMRSGIPDEEVELDLTNSHLHGLGEVEIRPTLEYVDLTANRLKAIEERILSLKGLRYLSLRQNLLPDGDMLSKAEFKGTLQELYINDNQLKSVPELTDFTALKRLEFSYNHEIRSLQPLKHVQSKKLVELYACENKIGAIENINHLTSLTILELGSNRIQEIENLEALNKLDQLWLGRNRISQITGLATLTCLRQLSLQANRLETMRGIGVLTSLEELYLSQNGIKKIEDLENLSILKVLDLGYNFVEKAYKACMQVEGLASQTLLTDLWLNNNKVEDLDHLTEALQPCKASLQVLYLEATPAAKSTDAYLILMKELLPSLEYLDSTPIKR